MRLIVGLGNPGAEYVGTRHNVGFEVIDILARRHNIAVRKRNFQAVFGEGMIGGERVMLVRPMTFMNLSGEAVASIARFYKIDPSDVIIILDEVALPVGQLRLRYQGSAGGHNGLANIIQLMHTNEIPRIRIGVGAPRPGRMIGHVLSCFPQEDVPLMREAFERAADAADVAIAEGFEMAMNRFNIRTEPRPPRPADEAGLS
jgi:PTH1 family peptidyl-tRNA hydrolase